MKAGHLILLAAFLAACRGVGSSAGQATSPGSAAGPEPTSAGASTLEVPHDAPLATAITRGEGVIRVASANPERPHLRYLDGQLSRNASCFIKLGNKLNPKVPPLYINGNPVGFC